jgi:hypothetical protein
MKMKKIEAKNLVVLSLSILNKNQTLGITSQLEQLGKLESVIKNTVQHKKSCSHL